MLIVGIAGGTGSGKTTVVDKIITRLPEGKVTLLPQDSYYRDNSHLPEEERKKINFDHPDSIEWSLLIEHIIALKNGEKIQRPIYSYLTCTRSVETVEVEPSEVLIIEGILILIDTKLRKLMDIKVYVDTDADDRLSRVISRDIMERGRSIKDVLERYDKVLKPMHLQFIEPTKRYADIIIPQGGDNTVAIDILVSVIESKINS
jgi:uridine kinase